MRMLLMRELVEVTGLKKYQISYYLKTRLAVCKTHHSGYRHFTRKMAIKIACFYAHKLSRDLDTVIADIEARTK